MAKTFNYYNFANSGDFGNSQRKNVPEGYYGRSGRDEYLYRPEISESLGFKNNRIGNSFEFMRDTDLASKNRNFSALNQTPEQKRYIVDQSYLRNNLLPPTQVRLNSLGKKTSGIRGVGDIGAKPTKAGGTPPNQKNNLLNYLVSPKGKGMAQGLLEASGYSDVPITTGQALAMGLKRSNESQATADASVAAQQKAYMDNLLVQSQIYKNYQPSGNPQHKFRPMTAEEKKSFGIPDNVPARFNETLGKPEIMSTGGGSSVTVVNNEAENKGNEDFFENRGKDFSNTITSIGESSTLADIDNQNLNRFEQLSEEAKTGKTSEFLSDVQGWADSLGVDLSGLDFANMGATQALNSVAGRFVMQQVQKTKGAVSDREMAYFMKISANIGNSQLGNQLIINMARTMNDRSIAENNLLQTFLSDQYVINEQRKENGEKPLSGYALELAWNKQKEQFRKDNQLFEGDIKDEIKAFYKENDIEYKDSTKIIEDTLKNYPNAEYGGVAEDGTLEFIMMIKGKKQYLYVEAN